GNHSHRSDCSQRQPRACIPGAPDPGVVIAGSAGAAGRRPGVPDRLLQARPAACSTARRGVRSDPRTAPHAGGTTMNHAAESGLRVSGLQMRYPNGHHALKGVDVTAAKGELVVVLGSNGCGKSTFMKCVMGLNEPTAGSIIVGDRELSGLTGEDRRQARLSLAMISQNANLVKRRSVLANVCCGALGRHHTLFTKLGGLPRTEIGTSLQK